MKCKGCGKKVFRNIIDKDGRIGPFRMCVNCGLINIFGWQNFKDNGKKGGFEYDFEN